MPRRLVTSDGTTFQIRDYELPPLGAADVRVRVRFAAPKHGTEAHVLVGGTSSHKKWDSALRMFLPHEDSDPPAPAEHGLGNMDVGTVTHVGPEVTRAITPGDIVFGYGQIREIAQAPEANWHPLGHLGDEDAVCTDPAHVAFVAVRDGNVRIGDHVAVLGLGAIGLMAVQIARAGGARRVYAVDPLPQRRAFATAHGADAAFDPREVDASLEIKHATGGQGVDVSIETSGNARALHEAIRCLRQCGTVVHVPWGPRSAAELHLDEEFHLNRPTIIGSQAWPGWGNPDRSWPLWTHERAFAAAVELFRAGLVTGQGIVTPIVYFEDAPAALADLFHRPETNIKAGVRFRGEHL
jgi:threonine dehydrogenase-like Zn-dependent dehydrogenase